MVIRMMILQMSVIQGILLCASNIAYIEDPVSDRLGAPPSPV